jgi:hypothetical protein
LLRDSLEAAPRARRWLVSGEWWQQSLCSSSLLPSHHILKLQAS